MNKKRIAQYCCAALVAAGVGLNIQNAIADYGIAENSLSLVAVGGSNSGSNSNSNSNTNGFDCFLDKDDCEVFIGSTAAVNAFVYKYHLDVKCKAGNYVDLTDLTEIYTAPTNWEFWRHRVRCGEDITCNKLMKQFGILK